MGIPRLTQWLRSTFPDAFALEAGACTLHTAFKFHLDQDCSQSTHTASGASSRCPQYLHPFVSAFAKPPSYLSSSLLDLIEIQELPFQADLQAEHVPLGCEAFGGSFCAI